MNSGLVVLATVAAALTARAVYRRVLGREARIRRAIDRRPCVRIADARDELVHVRGTVRAGSEILYAPVSRRPCSAFQMVIETWGRTGWKAVLDVADARPFTIVDQTGEAVIDTGAGPFSLGLLPDRRGTAGPLRAEDDSLRTVRSFLESVNVSTTDLQDRLTTFRYREAILPPEGEASVAGIGAREVAADGERTTLRSPPERFILRGTAACALLISNRVVQGSGR